MATAVNLGLIAALRMRDGGRRMIWIGMHPIIRRGVLRANIVNDAAQMANVFLFLFLSIVFFSLPFPLPSSSRY